jgi:hypothetical protein
MRRLTDDSGRRWEVVAGRESWGAIYAIFIPVEGEDELRHAPLSARSYEAAERELDALGDHELADLLARSVPKELG